MVPVHSLVMEMGKNLKDDRSSSFDSMGKIFWLYLQVEGTIGGQSVRAVQTDHFMGGKDVEKGKDLESNSIPAIYIVKVLHYLLNFPGCLLKSFQIFKMKMIVVSIFFKMAMEIQ